jgi:hypothetical protein
VHVILSFLWIDIIVDFYLKGAPLSRKKSPFTRQKSREAVFSPASAPLLSNVSLGFPERGYSLLDNRVAISPLWWYLTSHFGNPDPQSNEEGTPWQTR